MKLTPKQEQFCLDYIESGNAKLAYCNNYSHKNMKDNTLYVEANKLLNNPKISLRIEELRQKLEDEAIFTAKEIQMFWTSTILNDGEEMKDRLKASELLAKHIGMFESTSKDNEEITINLKMS